MSSSLDGLYCRMNVSIRFVEPTFFRRRKKVGKESRAAYENVTFSNGGGHGRTSMCGLKFCVLNNLWRRRKIFVQRSRRVEQ